jgi:hypothetical protein
MIAKATKRFWTCFDALPVEVQQAARRQFGVWKRDPFHPSLHFKLIADNLWSVRVTLGFRALARRRGELVTWFWIGTHAEYDRLIGG